MSKCVTADTMIAINRRDLFVNLPHAKDLRHAVYLVIENNYAHKYSPHYVERATQGLDGGLLLDACGRLIRDPNNKDVLQANM